MIIRRLEPTDAEAMAELHLDVWEEAYAGLVEEEILRRRRNGRPDRVARWRQIAEQSREQSAGQTWVATEADEGRLVGFVSSGPGRDAPENGLPPLELWGLYVRAEFYGQGLGYALVTEALGAKPAYLWVLDGNDRAIAFYERQGFRRDGRTQVEEIGLERRMVRGSSAAGGVGEAGLPGAPLFT